MRRLVPTLLVLVLGCAHGSRAPAPSCALPVGIEPAWVGPGQVLLLGEVHRTVEFPAFAGEVVCAASQQGPVILALEITSGEQPRLDAFLVDGLVAPLLEGPFWNRDPGDGRESQAMLDLLTRVRSLRESGRRVSVLAFDSRPEQRDLGMAQTLEQAWREHPEGGIVALVGNAHARNGFGVITSCAKHLADDGVPLHTVDLAGTGNPSGFDLQRDPGETTRSPRARPLTSSSAP
jgi:hypothetical protein